MGLGPADMEPTDQIWILPMLNVPIILRPLDNGHYSAVGDADIHEMMHGEDFHLQERWLQSMVLQ